MNYKKLILIIACFLHIKNLQAAVITAFFHPYPELLKENYCKDISLTLKNPPTIAQAKAQAQAIAPYCLYGVLDTKLAIGIIASYGGYTTASDEYGQISFPYLHTKPEIKLLVASKVTPIMMGGNTVAYWELEANSPASAYIIERKQDNDTKEFYWNTQPAQKPDNLRIDDDTLLIIEDPPSIYIPIGATPTIESPHLILPDFYVKKGIKINSQAVYMINLRHLFSPVKNEYKKDSQGYISNIHP
jgi:hypothetical protein